MIKFIFKQIFLFFITLMFVILIKIHFFTKQSFKYSGIDINTGGIVNYNKLEDEKDDLLVIFTSPMCKYCNQAIYMLNAINSCKKKIIFVVKKSDPKLIYGYYDRLSFLNNFNVIFDYNNATFKSYKIKMLPTIFIVKEGKIVLKSFGLPRIEWVRNSNQKLCK